MGSRRRFRDHDEARQVADVLTPAGHQLRLVEHPQTVVVQQPEVDRPVKATGGVATVEAPRQDHVLRSDQHCRLLRVQVPAIHFDAAHQYIDGKVETQIGDPMANLTLRLFD